MNHFSCAFFFFCFKNKCFFFEHLEIFFPFVLSVFFSPSSSTVSSTSQKGKMRKASCFWLLVTLSCSAWVCRGQTVEYGEYVVDFADWPMNGVPFVSEDGQVYPSYEERATLVWAGMVCAFSPSHFSPFTVFLVFFHSFLHVTGCN